MRALGRRILDQLRRPRYYSTTSASTKLDEVIGLPNIVAEDLVINLTRTPKVKPVADHKTLKFGAVTTDHMLQISWNEDRGWAAPEINPFAELKLHPCAQVLHYGTVCFEGMKAYKGIDSKVRLFRPDMNMARFLSSARRLALPEFDKVALLECIKEFVRLERDWIPEQPGFSAYVRPIIMSTHACLGVQVPKEAMLSVVMSPVGAYFPGGLKPVKLFVDTNNVRAFPGGVGDKKLGGNYAPTVVPQIEAAARGCSQVLYVRQNDGAISEAGSMNVFFLLKTTDGGMELVTPALDGTILAGITRDSVLAISGGIPGLKVSERTITIQEIEQAASGSRLLESFGTGTACMIQPIMGLLKDDGHLLNVPFDSEVSNAWIRSSPTEVQSGKLPFSLCGYLTRTLTDIQYGCTPSNWCVTVDCTK